VKGGNHHRTGCAQTAAPARMTRLQITALEVYLGLEVLIQLNFLFSPGRALQRAAGAFTSANYYEPPAA
jgi:hypothetical protein